jgi:hypothetical protein
MVRKVLNEAKGSTHAYVIQSLSFGRSGNIHNTKRIQKVLVPKLDNVKRTFFCLDKNTLSWLQGAAFYRISSFKQ